MLAAPPSAPAMFGRTLTDPSRVTPIAGAAGVTVAELFARCAAGIAETRVFIGELSGADWDRIGVHIIRGEISLAGIADGMIARHLEEHADQLDRLAAGA